MSRILTIAQEDARHAVHSRLLWGAIILLAVMFLPSTGTSARPDLYSIEEYLLLIPADLMTFSLVVVAAVGYNAIVGERVSGTVRFVLGLPAIRSDLVLGKLFSRVGIASVALVVILGIANLLVFQGYGNFHLLPFWVMGGWMVAYVVVWSAVTVGYSAAFDSPYRTLGALVVTYVVFSLDFGVWSVVVRPLFALLFTGSFDAPAYETLASAPLWVQMTERLNPVVDFWYAMRWSVEFVGPGTPSGGPLPHLLGTAVFLAFGAIPLVFGLGRFERTDLDGEQSGFQLGSRLWQVVQGVRIPVSMSDSVLVSRRNPSRRRLIATADVRHALQNWVIAGALLVTVLLVGPELSEGIDPRGISTVTDVLRDIPTAFSLPVLIVGIAVGHNAIVGERTDGTIRLLLGMPTTRRDILVGKLCSRLGIVTGVLLPLLVFAETLVILNLGGHYLDAALAWAGWVVLFAIVWTSITVGISAAVSSRYRSLGVVAAVYLLFGRGVGLWNPVVRPAIAFTFTGQFSADEFVYDANAPVWFRYLDHLNPFVALDTIRDGFFELAGYGTAHTELAGPLFLYSIGVLAVATVVPVAVGARQFALADLR